MKVTFIFFSFLISISVFAQKETTNWFFGRYAGLDFSNGSPIQLFGSPSISFEGENTSTISDKNGNLLFYSDGYYIYDNQNHIMPSFNTPNNISFTMITSLPGSDHLFYLFFVDPSLNIPGLRYHIIDMNLNGGKGDVIIQNQLLTSSTKWKFALLKHQNGKDFWLVAHEFNSSKFLSYLITSAGISSPIVSSSGNIYPTANHYPYYENIRSFKASPDGTKLALTYTNDFIGTDTLDIFDFNNQTGNVSNNISLNVFTTPYNIEFSPDSKKLYVEASEPEYHDRIFQMDLSSTNISLIKKSVTLISPCSTMDIASLQLGPDGKIYVAYNIDFRFIGVINDPNELGGACFYQDNVISLTTPPSVTGVGTNGALTNFISSYFQPVFTYTHTCVNDSTILSIADISGVASVQWDFGDPGTGKANYSTELNPKHKFSTPRDFNVKLTLSFVDGSSAFYYYNIYIKSPLTPINLGKDTLLCQKETLTLNPCYQGVSYLWSDGSHNPYYSATVSDTVWLEISNACGAVRDTILVTFQELPTVNLGKDTIICSGSQLLLDVSATEYTYKWKDGSSLSSCLVTEKDTVWVEVTSNNCSNSDSIIVDYINPPSVNLGKDTILCTGEQLLLSAVSIKASYLWNDGSDNASRSVTTTEQVWVSVSNKCGINADTLQVNFLSPPSVSIGNDTSLCLHDTLQLKLPAGYTYTWQDGSSQSNYLITSAGKYEVTAHNQCGTFTANKNVVYLSCNALYIPNLLTSNNDGLNDMLVISGIEDGQWKLELFNRWGDRVFQSNDYHNELNGQQLEEGIYYYALSKQGKPSYKGWLQVVK